MATKKLQALTQFLQQRKYIDPKKLHSEVEDPTLMPVTKENGNSLTISRHQYTALFSIENYTGSAEQLMADISTWLLDNDEDRWIDGLNDPEIQIDKPRGLIKSRVDVEIFVPFLECVNIVKDPQGEIQYDGQRWRLEVEPEPLCIAEDFELTAEVDGIELERSARLKSIFK